VPRSSRGQAETRASISRLRLLAREADGGGVLFATLAVARLAARVLTAVADLIELPTS
jgi:hypothetical protein